MDAVQAAYKRTQELGKSGNWQFYSFEEKIELSSVIIYNHIKWYWETLVDGLFKASTIVFLFFKKVILARSSESKTVDDIMEILL